MFDLLAIAAQHWRVILAIAATATCVALLLAIMQPLRYTYVTLIEIGTRFLADRVVPLESPDTVLTKLTANYTPRAIHEFEERNAWNRACLNVDARVPKNSQLLMLNSVGTSEDEPACAALHEAIVQYLREDHSRTMAVVKKELEIKIDEASHSLERLQDEARMIEGQLKRIGAEQRLVALETSAARELVTTATAHREQMVREASNETRAMALLMLTNEVRQNRLRLTELERRSTVELPNEKEKLTVSLAEKRRSQTEQQTRIESLKLQMDNMQETRAVMSVVRSLKPAGLTKSIVIAMGLTIGLVLGVLVALVVHHSRRKSITYRDASAADARAVSPTLARATAL